MVVPYETGPGWLGSARVVPIAVVAEALGLTIGRGWLSPCPSCGEEHRSHRERGPRARGPVGLTPGGEGWRCFRCGASGDVVMLACIGLYGERLGAGDHRWRSLAEWFSAIEGSYSPTVRPLDRTGQPTEAGAERERPPLTEVRSLWAACVPADLDAETAGWCRSRALDPGLLVERDLSRALPSDLPTPTWAACRQIPWARGGYRLLVPLYDDTGAMVSLQARLTGAGLPPGSPKAVSPAGFRIGGLILADAQFLHLLRCRAEAPAQPTRILVVEGIPDFLTWATRWLPGDPASCAVAGVISGSWGPGFAGAIPDGAEVIVRTHADAAGERYAQRLIDSLAGRSIHLVVARAGGHGDAA